MTALAMNSQRPQHLNGVFDVQIHCSPSNKNYNILLIQNSTKISFHNNSLPITNYY